MAVPYQYLFGPISSRRLGLSLGVDLLPMKSCTMNCRFCQLGDSKGATNERQDYVPTAAVIEELARWKRVDGRADHITLAGSGEPTLHLHFGSILEWVRNHTQTPSVLLTNGSLLHLPDVRTAAAQADKVKVTMSAWDEESFHALHRPAHGISFQKLIEGERAFREVFKGELSVEVFIVDGVNSSTAAAEKMAQIINTLGPDRIDLNTAVRPAAEARILATSAEKLSSLAKIFGPKANVAVASSAAKLDAPEVRAATLYTLIQRHPATAIQLAEEFGCSSDIIIKKLKPFLTRQMLSVEKRGAAFYYFDHNRK